MFKKLHLRLTFFCTFVSGLILVFMSLICLSFSEAESRESHLAEFQRNVNILINHFENQTIISHNWLSQINTDTHFSIDIQDNGYQLLFESLNPTSMDQKLFAFARQVARKDYNLLEETISSNSVLTIHAEFELVYKKKNYYASVAFIPKNGGVLNIVMLHSLKDLQYNIFLRRLLFASADIMGILLLGIFFWIFTWRMIQPLIINRQKQIEFIASASHELRSPLTVILSCLSAMKHASKEETEHFSNMIALEGKRMSRLIDDMLTLSRTDSSHFTIHKTAVELDTLLLSTYEKFEPLAYKKCISLKITLTERIVQLCLCDKESIEQVLTILLDNALSYTPSGGKVCLSLQATSDKIIIRVADNGIGIPNSEKEAIFDRFYRCDKSHKDKSHFGLGLCIAQEIIHIHKGKIKVEDSSEGGTCFVIYLGF